MEVSIISATTRSYCCSSSTELFSLKRRSIPTWHGFPVSISSTGRTSLPLFGRTEGSITPIENCFKVQVSSSQNNETSVVEARCIEQIYDALVERILPNSALSSSPNWKYMVGLAGPPGSGKSTLASEVVRRINMLWPQKAPSQDSQVAPLDIATVIPMDGFHLYRRQLDEMDNPEEAHARRGAPWTFDPVKLLTHLKMLRDQGSVYMPSFDHGVGDPVEDDIFVSLQHKIVIVEGNYLLLEEGSWKEISSIFDEKWFIEVDIDIAMKRVLKRHVSTGKPPDIAKWRIKYNDRPNAELVNKSKRNADLIIRSVDFSS